MRRHALLFFKARGSFSFPTSLFGASGQGAALAEGAWSLTADPCLGNTEKCSPSRRLRRTVIECSSMAIVSCALPARIEERTAHGSWLYQCILNHRSCFPC